MIVVLFFLFLEFIVKVFLKVVVIVVKEEVDGVVREKVLVFLVVVVVVVVVVVEMLVIVIDNDIEFCFLILFICNVYCLLFKIFKDLIVSILVFEMI